MAIQKSYSALRVQTIAVLFAFLGSYQFGKLADLITSRQCNVGNLTVVDTCGGAIVVLFGAYLGLLFCISVGHFGFIDWWRKYYYYLIIPLLLIGLIEIHLFILALAYTVAGIALGLLIRFIRERRAV